VYLLSRPNTLILQFCRYYYTGSGLNQITSKKNTGIGVNKLISLEQFMSCSSPCYSIGGVVNHIGENWYGGHYTFDQLVTDSSEVIDTPTWIKFDDTKRIQCKPDPCQSYIAVYNRDNVDDSSADFDAFVSDLADSPISTRKRKRSSVQEEEECDQEQVVFDDKGSAVDVDDEREIAAAASGKYIVCYV